MWSLASDTCIRHIFIVGFGVTNNSVLRPSPCKNVMAEAYTLLL